jgi:hypothetical protein
MEMEVLELIGLYDYYKGLHDRMLDQSRIEDMHDEDSRKIAGIIEKMLFLQKMINARYEKMEYNINLRARARKEETEKRWADRVASN